ncbi:MAG: thioredoxin family protein [Candidatus Eisenbacteria bacterium]
MTSTGQPLIRLCRNLTLGAAVLGIALGSGLGCGKGKEDAPKETAGAGESATHEAPTGRFGEPESVQWFNGSFDEALAAAKEQDKMLLVDVWSDHCAQCGIMDEEVWSSPEGVTLVGDAIAVKVPSDAPESYPFRHTYPITGLPAILLLSPDGGEVNRIVGYNHRDEFLVEANEMMTGVDPLPELEKRVSANPNDTATRLELLETYLFRANEVDAKKQMDEILALDPDNRQGDADRAIRALAKYYAFFLMDAAGSADIWRTIPDKFPNSSALTAALKATLDYAKTTGSVDEWTSWVCGLTNRYSANGRFNSSVAMYAFRQGVRGKCLADAASRAKQLNAAPANVDSVITVLSSGN